jgi:spore maturation protein CgeB
VTRKEKALIFESAGAVLNTLHPGEIRGVNCRLFEATGSGGAVVTEWRPELDAMYVEDKEIIAFRDFTELVQKLKWLIERPSASRELGLAGASRAHADHTYEHRLGQMLEVLAI